MQKDKENHLFFLFSMSQFTEHGDSLSFPALTRVH